LLERLRQNNLQQSFGRCDKSVFSKTFGITQECIVPGRIVVDPYQILKRDPWVKFHRYNLNTIAKELLGEEKIDVEYGDMPSMWNGSREKLDKFIEYCRKDAELSLRLVLEKGMLDKFFELAKISGLLLQDSFGGQSSRVETVLLHEFKKKGFVMPSRPTKQELLKRSREREKTELKGATVLEPKKGLHAEGCILVLDFRSLYPSIMRTYNVSPDTLLLNKEKIPSIKSPIGAYFVDQSIREGIFPSVLRELMDARIAIKKTMRSARGDEKRILNAKQLALKDMSNSFYGYTGYIRARLYMIDVANTITAHGRENLEKTKKLIEDNFDVEVLYADTDSVFLKTNIKNLDDAKNEGEKIAKFVSEKLPGYLELNFEKIYRTFLILTKKRYAGWKFELVGDEWVDNIEMKGIETIRRDWCALVSDTMEDAINIILKEGDVQKAINRVRGVLASLKKGEIPLDKLTIIKGITKSLESYEGTSPHIELAKKMAKRNPSEAPVVGDRLGFVIIRGNQLLSKRAEDPKYAAEHNLQIDSDYYMNSQLFPPIERILSAIGITKGELLGNGRQINMHDIMSNHREERHKIEIGFEKGLEGWESFVCKKCSKSYRRMPLCGSCECGGELLISYHGSLGDKVSK
jgi:DNA polymerase I